jgi:hypothetical protein
MENGNGDLVISGQITGASEVPYLDDLKLKGVAALLHSVDQVNFKDSGKVVLFEQYINDIEKTIENLKRHKRFQGEIKQQ